MVTHFEDDYKHAAVLKEDGSLDLSETPECALCHKEDPKCLMCAACRAVFYCSPECAKNSWNDRVIEQGGGVAPGHKIMCQQNKEQMAKGPALQAILQQFPWARVEKDGTFRSRILLASRGILGVGKDFGFWSEEPCCDEHGLADFEWGTSLLQPKHPDDRTGWKIPDEEIPWLTFNEEHKLPPFPPDVKDNWKDYYEWRGLPMSSPAALLLHWPLSVYQLLRKLNVIPNTAKKTEERQNLMVHYIGAEQELDYLPIFGELALLLPNTDLELIMFGEPAYMILHSAPKVTGAPSVVSESEDDVVYSYTAPEESGSGTVRIVLWGGGPTWTPDILKFGAPVPDAIIGLNAGLGAYQEWQSVIVSSRAFGIPFAMTDALEASLELNKTLIEALAVDLPEEAGEWIKQTYGEQGEVNLKKRHKMTSELNPFMRPGQRTGGSWSRLPAAVNGFTFIVTPKSTDSESE